MIPNFQTNQTLNYAIFLMATLSPTVANSLDNELYRQEVDSDGADHAYILDDALGNVLADLQAIGISLETDYSDLVDNLPALFNFLHLSSYLLPNTLYSRIKADDHLHTCLKGLVNGSLGDNETFLQSYLNELGGLETDHLALVPELQTTIDHYYRTLIQTETFSDYIANLLSLLEDEHLHPNLDSDRLDRFRAKTIEIIGRVSDVVNHFETDSIYETLCGLQRFFIIDLIKADNHIDYAYLLLESPETLPDDLIPGYQKRWYHYKVSHPWSLEYFTLRNRQPKPEQILLSYAVLYALSPTYADFIAYAKAVSSAYPHPVVLRIIDDLYSQSERLARGA